MKALILIGFRGCGKTTVGLALAEELGWQFCDTDELWEQAHGQKIVSFVANEGIEAFRRGEEAVLASLVMPGSPTAASSGLVLALGGGFVDWPASISLVESCSWPKVFLDVDADQLWERLAGSPERRKIGGLDRLEDLAALLEKRRSKYEKMANYKVKNWDINEALAELRKIAESL